MFVVLGWDIFAVLKWACHILLGFCWVGLYKMTFPCQTFCSCSNTQCRFPYLFFFFWLLKVHSDNLWLISEDIFICSAPLSTSCLWSKDLWTSEIHLSGKKTMFWKLYEDILNGVYSPHAARTLFLLFEFFLGASKHRWCLCLYLGLVQSLTEHSTHQRRWLLSIVWIICSCLYTYEVKSWQSHTWGI